MRTPFRLGLAAVALAIPTFCVPAAHAQVLTDITLFRIDTSNNSIAEGWNTRGDDGISNLYLLSNGSFVNSGNAAATAISINLASPGTYTFDFAGENVNGNVTQQLGLNLFFGNAITPGISARGTSPSGFVANNGIGNAPNFAAVASANTLTFVGGQTVTLSNFTYQTNSGADKVSSFSDAPGGTNDTIGSITLTVSAAVAPEASPLLLLSVGGCAGIVMARRRYMAR